MIFFLSAAANTGSRWRLVVLKAFIFVMVIWFVGSTLRTAVDKLTTQDWHLEAESGVLAAFLYCAGLSPAGLYWWWLLRKMGQRIGLLDAMRAYFVGHLGKYVPGKALVVVLRAGMANAAGADLAVASVAVIVETLTMMACGAAVALLLMVPLVPPDWKLALAAALAVVTGGPTLPPILNRLLRRMQQRQARTSLDLEAAKDGFNEGVGKSSKPLAARATAIDWRTVGVGWLAMLLVWVLLGLSLAALLAGLQSEVAIGVEQCLLAIAAVALATVAGFLSLLPGGLLVRELILLDLLAPVVGEPTALVAAVLLRLVWLAVELVACGGLCLLRAARRTPIHRE